MASGAFRLFGYDKQGKLVEETKQKMERIGFARRKKIENRAASLIADEMTLQELRQARKLTQVRMAKVLGISQEAFPSGKA